MEAKLNLTRQEFLTRLYLREMCTPPTLRRSMALLYVYFFISMVVEGIRENVVREIILHAITFNVTVAVVVGP